jgi:hypothetical protein
MAGAAEGQAAVKSDGHAAEVADVTSDRQPWVLKGIEMSSVTIPVRTCDGLRTMQISRDEE